MVQHLHMSHCVVSLDVVGGIHRNHSACNDNVHTLGVKKVIHQNLVAISSNVDHVQNSFTDTVNIKFVINE